MKLTLSLLVAAAGSAAAFAPSQQQAASSALAEKPFANELGAMAPVSCRKRKDCRTGNDLATHFCRWRCC